MADVTYCFKIINKYNRFRLSRTANNNLYAVRVRTIAMFIYHDASIVLFFFSVFGYWLG